MDVCPEWQHQEFNSSREPVRPIWSSHVDMQNPWKGPKSMSNKGDMCQASVPHQHHHGTTKFHQVSKPTSTWHIFLSQNFLSVIVKSMNPSLFLVWNEWFSNFPSQSFFWDLDIDHYDGNLLSMVHISWYIQVQIIDQSTRLESQTLITPTGEPLINGRNLILGLEASQSGVMSSW